MPKVAGTKAGVRLRTNTPVEDWTERYGLFVKREDLCCPPPGPPFSKIRGVYAHLENRAEKLIGVLDTYHSQAGHAVATVCKDLGKHCVNFYPKYKGDTSLREPQQKSESLGAELVPLQAGRSCILFHSARKATESKSGYMMPNALKLDESVEETAKEVFPTYDFETVIVPASSGTLAAGVIRGFVRHGKRPLFIIHLGYSRPEAEVLRYINRMAGVTPERICVIDEGFAYKDTANLHGEVPPWACNQFYDLKAFQWFVKNRETTQGRVLFWNIG